MHLPESEVVRALPYRGFLREYVEYAARCTDAPLAYHVGVGLALLTQTCPIGLSVPTARPVYGNLFVLLVGESGEARKGEAMAIGVEMLREVNPKIVGEEPGSEEGLVEGLRDNNRQLIHYDEFGNFLAAAQAGPLQKIKTKLNTLYDNAAQGRALAKSRRGAVLQARLSLLAGCAPDFLERHTEPVDWTGGFFSRFLMLAATRERSYPMSGCDTARRAVLVARFAELAGHALFGPCSGLSIEASALHTAFQTRVATIRVDPVFRGVVVRAPAFALKIALLLSWDFGEARSGGPWAVTAEAMQVAIAIADMHVQSMLQVSGRIDVSKDMRDRRIVLASIDDAPTTVGEVTRRAKMLKDRRLKTILETLMEERLVEPIWANGSECYRRCSPEATLVASPVGSFGPAPSAPHWSPPLPAALPAETTAVYVNGVSRPRERATVRLDLEGLDDA